MANYCNGTILVIGDIDTLNQMSSLLNLLTTCSRVSGFNADNDWMPHIFTTEVTEDGIFYEGHTLLNGSLEVYVRAARTDGKQFFKTMAEQLGVELVWTYVSDFDGKEHTFTYNRGQAKCLGEWKLRTLDVINATSAPTPDSKDSEITWRDIELQLKLAVSANSCLRGDYYSEQDGEFITMSRTSAAIHVYTAASLLYTKLIQDFDEEDDVPYDSWEVFLESYRGFQRKFPQDPTEVKVLNKALCEEMNSIVWERMRKLFGLTKELYKSDNPKRGLSLSMLRIDRY